MAEVGIFILSVWTFVFVSAPIAVGLMNVLTWADTDRIGRFWVGACYWGIVLLSAGAGLLAVEFFIHGGQNYDFTPGEMRGVGPFEF